jgi:ribonucleotide reductase alpha subunit
MKEWSNLARIVYRRTYSRRDSGSYEGWEQTVERAVAGNVKGHNVPEEEIKELIKYANERKAGPAGRGYWFSGAPAQDRIGGAALVNCWFFTADDWNNFVIAQDLLMLGGGVGLSVEHEFTSKLPKVKKDVHVTHKATKDADFIIPDSREGWCELTRRVLESYFVTGKPFTYSTVCVRGYGEPIVGFGGVASGPLPLVRFVETLSAILVARGGKHVRPIDAADILTATGEMVVAGNVRRSAIIILGDCWDKKYLKAKRWDLGSIPTHRSCANYSVVCEDTEDLHPLFWKTYEQGEAFGIVNRTAIQKYGRMGELKPDSATGVNPCQPEWATVMTPDGIRCIKDISIGSTIWSGNEWTKVTNKWSTGVKEVFEYKTRAGIFVGTDNHKVVSNKIKQEVKNVEEIDISYNKINYEIIDHNLQDVMDGLVFGDGYLHKASNNLPVLCIGKKDYDYHNSCIAPYILCYRPGISDDAWHIKTTVSDALLKHTYERTIPDRFYKGDFRTVCGFLKGLFTANGSVARERVTLKQTSFAVVRQVQEMLSLLGIRSYYTVNKSKEIKWNNGTYISKQSYDINITGKDRELFYSHIGFIQEYKTKKLLELLNKCSNYSEDRKKKTYEIVSIETCGLHEVFDLTVESNDHTYWTGGLLVSNCGEATLENGEPCNLAEIPICNLESEEEFIKVSRLMLRYTKRVTMEKYHHAVTQAVIERNRRVGIGITGCLASNLFVPGVLDKAYAAIQEEDQKYSKELGIPTSKRTTLCKPSGTMSKVLDCNGYEGIHGAFSRYIIQRIRVASNDPLIPRLRAAGHKMESVLLFDGTFDQQTQVVDFYVQAPNGYPVTDEDWDTWKQLDVLKFAQKHWADQAVSVTVYYERKDIPKIKEWLAQNLSSVKSISFLCQSDHGFKQAPKEAITAEQYQKMSAKIKPIELDDVGEGSMIEGLECSGGTCPVR